MTKSEYKLLMTLGLGNEEETNLLITRWLHRGCRWVTIARIAGVLFVAWSSRGRSNSWTLGSWIRILKVHIFVSHLTP